MGRYFKIKIGRISKAEVFLDSDQLEELDLIFDIVRCSTQNLVTLLTAETMHRMWCAGEITTAVRSKIPIVPVACDDYVPPDEPALALLHQVCPGGLVLCPGGLVLSGLSVG